MSAAYTAYSSSNYDNLLAARCDIADYDKLAQKWKTDDGQWYSLCATKLKALLDTLETLTDISKLDVDSQCIIANNGLGFIKNIVSCPEPNSKHVEIQIAAWHLMFSVLPDNTKNQCLIWNECNELLMTHLSQHDFRHKDSCRFIVYQVYAFTDVARHEGLTILKMLLNCFHVERQTGPLKEQGLTMLLEHFITNDADVSTMYLKLSCIEKMALLQFTIDHVERGNVTGFKHFRVSIFVLSRICDDFVSKSQPICRSSDVVVDDHLQQLFALFAVIAIVAEDPEYRLNECDIEVVLSMGRLLKYVQYNGAEAEATFSVIQRYSDRPLQRIILETISNFVKGNKDHREKAIEFLVDFIVANEEEADAMRKHSAYRETIFTLIDICQPNPLDIQYFERIVARQCPAGTKIHNNLLMDINYKGKRRNRKEMNVLPPTSEKQKSEILQHNRVNLKAKLHKREITKSIQIVQRQSNCLNTPTSRVLSNCNTLKSHVKSTSFVSKARNRK